MIPKTDIEISPLAFSKIIDWASSNTEREIGGYLVGYIVDEKVIITEAFYATADSQPTFVSFDNIIQYRIIEDIEKKGKSSTIVGWFHTHPSLGCFLSGTDIATQKIYQSLLPKAVAMVNDGNKYAHTRNQADFQARFYRVHDNRSKEISFGIITNPNELVDLLVDYVQSEENITNIIQTTANAVSIEIKDSTINKKKFAEAVEHFKMEFTKTQSELETMQINSTTYQKQLENQFITWKNHQNKRFMILLYFMLTLLILTLSGLITLIILFQNIAQ